MIIRSFNTPFEVQDWTQEVSTIPNLWGTINNLGIFSTEKVTQHTVTFQETYTDFGLVLDRVRGERNNVNKDVLRKLHSFVVPHFPLDDQILPKDLQGKSAYQQLDEAEVLAAVRLRKMERIRNSHAVTLEFARAQALTLGTIYAPNGTVALNWFDEFGITQTVVNFAFSTATTDVLAQTEAVIAAMQDNAGSVSFVGIVALCSPGFFSKLISHATVKLAWTYYNNGRANILVDRSAPNGSVTAMHREFEYGGIRFIEMRDSFNGNVLIPANTAVFLPTGTDYFKTYYSPAERFGLVNTEGEEVYMWEHAAPNGTAIELETESNFANALLKPTLVIKGTIS